VLIRPATYEDSFAILSLWEAMYKEMKLRPSMRLEYTNPKNVFHKIVVRIEQQEWRVIVAEDAGELVGFMMSFLRWPAYNPCHKIGFAEALYVHPAYRGSSIYKDLINDSIKHHEKDDMMKEMEFMSVYDDRMIQFYARLGFEPVQVIYRKKEV